MLMHRHLSGWHDRIFRGSVRYLNTCCASLRKSTNNSSTWINSPTRSKSARFEDLCDRLLNVCRSVMSPIPLRRGAAHLVKASGKQAHPVNLPMAYA